MQTLRRPKVRDQATAQIKQYIIIQFHRSLLEASGLQPLVAFGDLLRVFFQRFRESVKKAEWKVGMEAQRRIVHHLAAGRVDAATGELRRHIDSHRERICCFANSPTSASPVSRGRAS